MSTPDSLAVLSSPSVERVRAALAERAFVGEIVALPGSARTAQAAADALGCDAAQIANSLVFRRAESGAPVLVMASGANRVDPARLETILGEPVAKADAAFVREHTGLAIGGVAPVGHPNPISTIVDRSLQAYPAIWAAAGHPHTVFQLTFAELVRITGGLIADVAQEKRE
ncbi:MAG: YbaK/EbsC family protein [Burkholderiales bacterium]